jgi:hypothetical protein
MNDKIVRMNIRVPEYIRDWYKVQGDKYSVPYTNYISMLLTQIYERETDKELVKEFNQVMKQMKEMSGNVTAEEMIKQMQDIILKIDKLENDGSQK